VARIAATNWVGADARVLASPVVFPLVAERETALVLDLDGSAISGSARLDGIDVLVFDSDTSGWSRSRIRVFEDDLIDRGFRLRFDSEGVRVWWRRPGSG
jgi:hypothetical protein